MTEDYEWFEVSVDHLPPSVAKRVPRWARRVLRTEDGTIYVPSVMAGSEMEVFLCAGYDGVDCLKVGKHVYYPADWVAREFPVARPAIESMKKSLREIH